MSRPRPLSATQRAILANLRDNGDVFGRHGWPSGQSGYGGWEGSLMALIRRGLVDGRTQQLTDAGREAIGEAVRHDTAPTHPTHTTGA